MIEHVGKENLAGFVRDVKTLLKPGGLALLHFITGGKRRCGKSLDREIYISRRLYSDSARNDHAFIGE